MLEANHLFCENQNGEMRGDSAGGRLSMGKEGDHWGCPLFFYMCLDAADLSFKFFFFKISDGSVFFCTYTFHINHCDAT